MRMARNRNLNWPTTAKTFLTVTGRYWSAATYGGVGHGRTQLIPELLADFSAVLDVPAGDLAVLTGVALSGTSSMPKPAVAGGAEFIWDVRRLSASQLHQVSDIAESMLHWLSRWRDQCGAGAPSPFRPGRSTISGLSWSCLSLLLTARVTSPAYVGSWNTVSQSAFAGMNSRSGRDKWMPDVVPDQNDRPVELDPGPDHHVAKVAPAKALRLVLATGVLTLRVEQPRPIESRIP
jgi:hypothetical protein